MSKRMFHGLCLGGPTDGAQKASDMPSFNVFKQPRLSTISAMSAGPEENADLVLETVRYRHEIMCVPPKHTGGMGLVDIGFWVPEGETLLDAMRRLVRGYRPKAAR